MSVSNPYDDSLNRLANAVEKIAEQQDSAPAIEKAQKTFVEMIHNVAANLEQIMDEDYGSDTIFIRSSKIRKLIEELKQYK
jgi:hypothetical protein